MKLSEYVRMTLVEILEGVATAQKEAERFSAAVNPSFRNIGVARSEYLTSDNEQIHMVEFDVVLQTTEASEGGGSLRVLAVGARAKLETTDQSSGRVKFTVPITLPRKPA